MTEAAAYKTLHGEGTGELVDRKSEFLGFAVPVTSVEEADAYVAGIRKLHHDARHCVYAYVLRSGLKKYSDDGEPQGSAGRPVLDVLEKTGLEDALVCVVRYFGGILLGTGGLVRAYSGAASAAVENAGIRVMQLRVFLRFTVSYNDWARLERPVTDAGARVERTDYGADVTVTVSADGGREGELTEKIRNLTAGKCEAKVIGEKFS